MAPPEVVSRKPFPLVPAFKERPILFSAPMVRALLDGSKTQTRRVVKPPRGWPEFSTCDPFAMPPAVWWWDGAHERVGVRQDCPYGQPGDRLWVREAIRLVPDQEPDDGTGRVLSTYGADGSLTVADAWPWKRSYLPPMHCPRGLSRIDLEVTGVRVERLQEISHEDAEAEGVKCSMADLGFRDHFHTLWERINGADVPLRDAEGNTVGVQPNPARWAANPWVWVVEFRRVQP